MKKLQEDKQYFLCSQKVIEHFKNAEKSKPFKSGYRFERDVNYYVAKLNFNEVEKYFNSIEDLDVDFWCRECVDGSMGIKKIRITYAKKNGLFREIEEKINLTTEKNLAMVIKNLSNKYGLNPIEFIDKKL